MRRINPGEFKHRIDILKSSPSKDKENKPSKVWNSTFGTKAKILNTSAKEVIMADGENSIHSKRLIIRYPKNVEITTDNRISYKGNQYNIKYVSDIEDLNVYLEIVAEIVR